MSLSIYVFIILYESLCSYVVKSRTVEPISTIVFVAIIGETLFTKTKEIILVIDKSN